MKPSRYQILLAKERALSRILGVLAGTHIDADTIENHLALGTQRVYLTRVADQTCTVTLVNAGHMLGHASPAP